MTEFRDVFIAFNLAVHLMMTIVMIAVVIKSYFFGSYTFIVFPFVYFWISCFAYAKIYKYLEKKKIFVVLKDRDW